MTRVDRYTVTLVKKIETFIGNYVTLADPMYDLPIALWTIGTYIWPHMDAFPYLCITAATKRSGKSRLAEMIGFACSNPCQSGALTPAAIFKTMAEEKPTLFMDEAETLSSESASTMRAVLNMGYRKGQVIRRVIGQQVKEYQVYCPKVFVLIGDVYDTLKDRSIVVRMKRAEPKKRFMYEFVKAEGAAIREEIAETMEVELVNIINVCNNHKGLDFMSDRDEEIWLPLFALCQVLCPERLEELSRCAVDIATEKTQDAKRYVNLLGEEKKEDDDYFSKLLLKDMHVVINGQKAISTYDALTKLLALPTSPWRKYRGDGLTVNSIAEMLSRFGVRPTVVSLGSGRKERKLLRGYKKADVEKAMHHVV